MSKGSPARVLYCESSADGTVGGSHSCLLYLVEHLDRTQYEPIVLFYEEHALMERFRAAAETIVHRRDSPVHWRGLGLAQAGRAINFAKFLGVVASHIAFMRRHRIDLLHLNNSITRHQDWMLAARLAGIPCVVHERGLSEQYEARDYSHARNVSLIIPMSAWIRDHMIDRGFSGENIRVMYDGLDPSLVKVNVPAETMRQTWNVPPGARVVGIVGNVRAWKGQETVVRAFIDVVKQFPDVVCFFVGATTPADESYLAGLKSLISQAGIEAQVRFTGYQKEVPSFINMMEFLIHASVAPEPFGMVVLEGMAQKKAVIGSRAGGPVEMILDGETGFTFPPGDPKALAARMVELLSDSNRCRQMGEAGYKRLLAEFTVARYMQNIHGTYRAILDGRPVPSELGLPTPARALHSA